MPEEVVGAEVHRPAACGAEREGAALGRVLRCGLHRPDRHGRVLVHVAPLAQHCLLPAAEVAPDQRPAGQDHVAAAHVLPQLAVELDGVALEVARPREGEAVDGSHGHAGGFQVLELLEPDLEGHLVHAVDEPCVAAAFTGDPVLLVHGEGDGAGLRRTARVPDQAHHGRLFPLGLGVDRSVLDRRPECECEAGCGGEDHGGEGARRGGAPWEPGLSRRVSHRGGG